MIFNTLNKKHLLQGWGVPVLLLTVLMLAACVKPVVSIKRLSQVKKNEAVVVGRVELVPPLKPDEQNIEMMGPYNDPNQYFFYIGRKMVEIPSSPIKTPHDQILMEKFGTTFYVRNPQRPMVFITSFIYMQLTRQVIERTWLPGGIVVRLEPGDRAVYMGTLRYHRNAFFDIEKIEIVDDYQREKQAFEDRFGKEITLRKRLAEPVNMKMAKGGIEIKSDAPPEVIAMGEYPPGPPGPNQY